MLLLTCPDRPGLVAAVSEFILRHRGNILHADQHSDPIEELFLQRVEFDLPSGDLDALEDGFRQLAERFGMRWSLRRSGPPPRVAILVSKLGHCAYDLLGRWHMGDLPIDVVLVASNHERLSAMASGFDVPFHHLPIVDGERPRQEAELASLLAAENTDLVVLARYMQILSPELVARYPRRMINIHHSFLPAFAGAAPYRQAHERGVKIIGATAHYVTDELDQGPIIEQDVTRVSHRDAVEDLVQKGRDLEKVVLARAVRWHIEHRVLVYGNKTVVFG